MLSGPGPATPPAAGLRWLLERPRSKPLAVSFTKCLCFSGQQKDQSNSLESLLADQTAQSAGKACVLLLLGAKEEDFAEKISDEPVMMTALMKQGAMTMSRLSRIPVLLVVLAFVFWTETSEAQETLLLDGSALTRVMPTSFYFEGLSGPTQMRNATAVRFGEKRHVIAALVDTAGYSSEVRAKYEGFLITDSKVSIGDKEVGAGAYGFGVTKDSKFNLFDVGGNLLLSVQGTKDAVTKTPRPLTMTKENGAVRLYRGRSYVTVTPK
jgi:hypothetical protein